MTNGRTRVAVVGAGFFGQYHARQYATLPDVELVAVVDRDEAHARRIADETGCQAVSDYRELVGRVDAVSVVVPTAAHFQVAREFLSRGVATLVEKPLAFSLDEARAMVDLAHRRNAVLQTGHVERFNPVWTAFEEADFRPTFLETRRYSPFPFRSLDVSVVPDVMIHDLDLVLAAAGSPVTAVEAVGCQCVSPKTDRAEVRLTFANGVRANLSASRVHHQTERVLRGWNDAGNIELDFFRRTTTTHSRREPVDPAVVAARPLTPEQREQSLAAAFRTETKEYDRTIQPLRLELAHFVDCAREGRTPKVSGQDGYEAVLLADRIERAIVEAGVVLRRAA